MNIETTIRDVFEEVYERQNPEGKMPELSNDTVLLETGLDSLGFAILVTRLEMELDFDPFTLSDEAYYPQTFGDFVKYYEKFAPAAN